VFGVRELQKVTTKETKSTKIDFDDLFNRVFGSFIEVHRCNNTGLKEDIERCVL
jgi:hypothetical protein